MDRDELLPDTSGVPDDPAGEPADADAGCVDLPSGP